MRVGINMGDMVTEGDLAGDVLTIGPSSFKVRDFEVVPAGTMRALAQAAEGALDPALRHRLLQLIPQKYGGNG